MDEIREKIQYKDGPIEICMNRLTSMEQYEMIRLLIAFPEKKVLLCTHEHTNSFVDQILKEMNVSFFQCFTEAALFK
jgi:hypothetical protein